MVIEDGQTPEKPMATGGFVTSSEPLDFREDSILPRKIADEFQKILKPFSQGGITTFTFHIFPEFIVPTDGDFDGK
jgi:hypothetical protein